MPPTAKRAPTVALRGRVRGLCRRGRRSGSRWYFMASITSLWHSTLSLSSGLDSMSARNYKGTHRETRQYSECFHLTHNLHCACSDMRWFCSAQKRRVLISSDHRVPTIDFSRTFPGCSPTSLRTQHKMFWDTD